MNPEDKAELFHKVQRKLLAAKQLGKESGIDVGTAYIIVDVLLEEMVDRQKGRGKDEPAWWYGPVAPRFDVRA